jgi:hypothetical protein
MTTFLDATNPETHVNHRRASHPQMESKTRVVKWTRIQRLVSTKMGATGCQQLLTPQNLNGYEGTHMGSPRMLINWVGFAVKTVVRERDGACTGRATAGAARDRSETAADIGRPECETMDRLQKRTQSANGATSSRLKQMTLPATASQEDRQVRATYSELNIATPTSLLGKKKFGLVQIKGHPCSASQRLSSSLPSKSP